MLADLAQAITVLANLLTILVIIWVVVSWVLPPYHPLREALDRFMEPILAPIRRVLPATGMIDLSPMVLMILIIVLERILVSLLSIR